MNISTFHFNPILATPHIQCQLFCKILDLFIFQTGQFPHFPSLQNCAHSLNYQTGHTKKECAYLDSIRKLKLQLITDSNAAVNSLFLIMLGGLPTNPTRAILVDFGLFNDVSESIEQPDHSESIFTQLFGLLVQQNPFTKAFGESKVTRMYVYVCRSSRGASDCSWFLPRVNFRLARSCPLYVIRIRPNVKCGDEVTFQLSDDGDDDEHELVDIIYQNDSTHTGLIWYACPFVFQGLT